MGTAELQSIVAQALTLNSQLLASQADPQLLRGNLATLERRLLMLAAAWRLLLRSPSRGLAREGYDRLRSLQRRLEDRVAAEAELQRWLTADDLEPGADALLYEGMSRLLAPAERELPLREMGQVLLDDSRALGELSLDLRRLRAQVPLAETVELEATKAMRRTQQGLDAEATVDQRRRARRWLMLHLSQLELLRGSLSEETARASWYRERLQELLHRLHGLELLQAGLDRLASHGLRLAKEQALLKRKLAAEGTRLSNRSVPLARYAFEVVGQADGSTVSPAASAELPLRAAGGVL